MCGYNYSEAQLHALDQCFNFCVFYLQNAKYKISMLLVTVLYEYSKHSQNLNFNQVDILGIIIVLFDNILMISSHTCHREAPV